MTGAGQRLMGLDRRAFLRTALGAAAFGACRRSGGRMPPAAAPRPQGDVAPVPVGQLPPVPRPVLRLASDDYDMPLPLFYLPPAYQHLALVYDTLLWWDPTDRLAPWLATGYDRSPDGLSHTFQLRPGVKWHDGRPFTADDVAFSFRYFLAQDAAGHVPDWVIFKPQHVAGARASGPQTVEVRLDKPAVNFPTTVAARFPIIPRHIWEPIENIVAYGREEEMIVGTGPFRFAEYRPRGGTYLFEANDEFFLGTPFVRRIEMFQVGDELTALRAGEIHAGGFQAKPTSSKVLASFTSDPSFGYLEDDPGFLVTLHWNLGRGGALADVRFRRACAHAIDRNAMVSRLLGRQGHPGNPGMLAPGHPFRVEVEQYPFDRVLANRLLDDAGYARKGGRRTHPDGKPLRLSLKSPGRVASAAAMVLDAMEALGVEIDLEPVDQEFNLGSNYDMVLFFFGGAGADTDPDFLRGVYSSKASKKLFFVARGYANPEFDDLAERQLVTADEAERRRLIARMQQLVADDLPLLPLYYPTAFLIYRTSVFDDQWVRTSGGGNPVNKQALATGLATGTTQVRPFR